MRQFRDLSDIVELRKAGKLDRQNPIQSLTAEFFEITTSVSFHECARGSIYYPYIPPTLLYLEERGIDRSRGGVRAWLRGCALSYRSSPVGVTAQLLNTKCNFSSLYVPRYPAPAPVSDHLEERGVAWRSFACAVIESTRGFRDAYMEIELPPICPDARDRISPPCVMCYTYLMREARKCTRMSSTRATRIRNQS